MKKRNNPSALKTPTVAAILVLCTVAAVLIIRLAYGSLSHRVFASPDKTVSDSTVQLCSPYANLCFTRPTNWARSSILHVNGTAKDTIEINPPTGTLLEFAKTSDNTATNCDKTSYKDCIIKVARATSLKNNLHLVTGMLIDSPDANCSYQCTVPKYTPFVILVSSDDFQKYKLAADTSTFDSFNPRVLVTRGRSIFLEVTPGKEFSVDAAMQWQNGPEAKAAEHTLASVSLYSSQQ